MTARVPDENGWYQIANNPLSKVGVFAYRGSMIDPNGTLGLDHNKVYNVYRSAAELSAPETIDSFKLLPWIDDHQMLGQDSIFLTPPEEKGIDGIIGEDVYFSNGFLYGNIKLFSSELADKIDEGKTELSCGFRCQYELEDGVFGDKHYSIVQTKIRGNHLASVQEGRMGPEVAVLDHLTFTIDSRDFKIMPKKIILKDVLAMDSIDAADMPRIRRLLATLDEDDANKNLAEDMDDDKKGEDEDDKNKNLGEDGDDPDKKGEDGDDDPDKKGEDGDDDPDKKGKKGEDGDDAPGKATDSAAMDSLRAEVADLRKESRGGVKRFMRELQKRDKLVAQASEHIGTFDHEDMVTAQDVAVYTCDKLELKVKKGHEVSALEAYFHNRRPSVAFGEDSIIPTVRKAGGVVAKYFAEDAK